MTNKVRNSLDWFILFYEEFEEKKVVKAKAKITSEPKVSFKKRVSGSFKQFIATASRSTPALRSHFTPKKTKKITKDEKKAIREQQKRGILGIGQLFVVMSITFSSYVILNGVDSNTSKVVLIPQVAYALYTLIKAFSKIYK